jgi:hypothetical protein
MKQRGGDRVSRNDIGDQEIPLEVEETKENYQRMPTKNEGIGKDQGMNRRGETKQALDSGIQII